MGGDPSNPYPTGVNIPAGATMYSTLAGILAGFAFTAIVLLVVTWLDDGDVRARRVLATTGRALVASFFGLLIMCVLYAAESAGAYSWGLAISENVILAAGFSGVSILLIYAIVLMLEAADEAAGSPSTRKQDLAMFTRAFACILNPLILGVAYDSVNDYESIRYGLPHSIAGLDVLALIFLGIECAVTIWSLWILAARSGEAGRYKNLRTSTSRLLLYAGLGLPVVSAVGYLTVDITLPQTGTVSPAVVVLVLTVVFFLTCAATLQLTFTRPSRDNAASNVKQTGADPTTPQATSAGDTTPPAGAAQQDADPTTLQTTSAEVTKTPAD